MPTSKLKEARMGKYFRIVADVIADGVSVSDMLIENGYSVKVNYD